MKKPMMLATLAIFALSLTCVAVASTDPLIGTWKADTKPGGDLKAETITVTSAPDGYAFDKDMHTADGSMDLRFHAVPDGKPHAVDDQGAQVTAICHRVDPRKLACDISFAGESTPAVFTLSADGKTLTEVDAIEGAKPETTVLHKHSQTGRES